MLAVAHTEEYVHKNNSLMRLEANILLDYTNYVSQKLDIWIMMLLYWENKESIEWMSPNLHRLCVSIMHQQSYGHGRTVSGGFLIYFSIYMFCLNIIVDFNKPRGGVLEFIDLLYKNCVWFKTNY